MLIKKSGGVIFGAELTAAERKAMKIEFGKYFAKLIDECTGNIDATVLWVLHEEFGFGEKRLRRFRDIFLPALKDLTEHYDMGDLDRAWLCKQKLLDDGIDIGSWENVRWSKNSE